MTISILMPALSPTMEKGNLAKWHVKEGDKVASGDVIAEIETDKATMEVEAVEEGTVGRIVVAEGTADVPVNDLIAVLLEDGEDESALDGATSKAAGSKPEKAAEEAPSAPKSAAPAEAPAAAQTPAPASSRTRVFASPLARRLAAQAGIEIGALRGSGPHGRIVRRDVEAATAAGVPTRTAATTPSAPAAPPASPVDYRAFFADGTYEEVPLDNMRKTIARRLTASKRDIPHFYLTIDCRIDALLEARKRLNALGDQYRISVNDFVIKACGLALRKVPAANATWAETHILRHSTADISMAVAIEGGLITPIVRSADTKGLAEIAAEAKDLAARARDRKLQPSEYEGGTFSVSNLGMFGIRDFTAVINPPQAAILAVGAGERRAVVTESGAIEAATVMTVTLSCDHRVIDGALGAQLLAAFKGYIEDPVTMLL
jgi:pyruvate dehydrogenase E2 component (dihydrolipoamide acetyltransferase)